MPFKHTEPCFNALRLLNKSLYPMNLSRGSVAFEYVIVTIFGVGLSLLIMSTAKTMIKDKLVDFKASIEKNLSIQGDDEDESW